MQERTCATLIDSYTRHTDNLAYFVPPIYLVVDFRQNMRGAPNEKRRGARRSHSPRCEEKTIFLSSSGGGGVIQSPRVIRYMLLLVWKMSAGDPYSFFRRQTRQSYTHFPPVGCRNPSKGEHTHKTKRGRRARTKQSRATLAEQGLQKAQKSRAGGTARANSTHYYFTGSGPTVGKGRRQARKTGGVHPSQPLTYPDRTLQHRFVQRLSS